MNINFNINVSCKGSYGVPVKICDLVKLWYFPFSIHLSLFMLLTWNIFLRTLPTDFAKFKIPSFHYKLKHRIAGWETERKRVFFRVFHKTNRPAHHRIQPRYVLTSRDLLERDKDTGRKCTFADFFTYPLPTLHLSRRCRLQEVIPWEVYLVSTLPS